jgi:putative hemolysin
MTETAFSCLNKYRFQVQADNGSKAAKQVLKVEAHFDTALVTILVAINGLSVILSSFFTTLFLRWMVGVDETLTSLVSSIVLTLLLYLFGETIPKQIARKIPNGCAKMAVYPLEFFMIVFYPLSILFRGVTLLAKKLFHSEKAPELTEEDFTSVIETNEKHGLLEENESDLIQNSFDFADTSVKEVLTPKKEMFMLDLKGLSSSQLAHEVCNSRFSRIPVYYENPDKVVGVLIVKKFLAAYLRNPALDIKDYLDKPYIVNPTITIDDLTDGFRKHQTQLALVYQEGKLIGMVTMEDVLEELVGPISEKGAVLPEKTVRR